MKAENIVRNYAFLSSPSSPNRLLLQKGNSVLLPSFKRITTLNLRHVGKNIYETSTINRDIGYTKTLSAAMISELHNLKFSENIVPLLLQKITDATSFFQHLMWPWLSLILITFLSHFLETSVLMKKLSLNAPLISFFTAALLSNLNLLPPSHNAFDACWNIILPMSLSFACFSIFQSTAISWKRDTKGNLFNVQMETQSKDKRNRNYMKKFGEVFLIGSFGSFIGAFLAFFVSTKLNLFPGTSSVLIAKCCGTICSTYIGGTVNFFQTARVIGLSDDTTILGTMAAADCLIMSLYFSLITSLLKSKQIQDFFYTESRAKEKSKTNFVDLGIDEEIENYSVKKECRNEKNISSLPAEAYVNFKGYRMIMELLLGFFCAKSSSSIESFLGLSGLSALLIVLLSFICSRILIFERLSTKLVPSKYLVTSEEYSMNLLSNQRRKKVNSTFIEETSSNLSSFFYTAFFVGIGSSARLSSFLSMGPSSVILMMITLIIHLTTLFLPSLVNILFRGRHSSWTLSELCISSNANIGGPSTAAAMAGSIPQTKHLVIPASLWGTFGYAIATSIGVFLNSILQKYFCS